MMHAEKSIDARWAAAAARAPGIAARRLAVRTALLAMTLPGSILLFNVARWAVRHGEAGILAVFALHVAVILLAVGLPSRSDSLRTESLYLRALRHSFGNRAERLGALGRALLAEVIVLFLYTPLMSLIAGHRLQWPAYFVIAVGACIITWPLHRIAMAQRLEAIRLTSADR